MSQKSFSKMLRLSTAPVLMVQSALMSIVLSQPSPFMNGFQPPSFSPRFNSPFFGGGGGGAPSQYPPMIEGLGREVGLLGNPPLRPRGYHNSDEQRYSDEADELYRWNDSDDHVVRKDEDGWTTSEKEEVIKATQSDNHVVRKDDDGWTTSAEKVKVVKVTKNDDKHDKKQQNAAEKHEPPQIDPETINVKPSVHSKQSGKKDEKVLLDLKFYNDFGKFDPRNPRSEFEFGQIDNVTEMRQDNAAFLSGKHGIVNMATVPMGRWLPQRFGLGAVIAQFDAAAKWKKPLNISDGQVLKTSLKFNCRTVDVKLNKFPRGAITNVKDDPRLAACSLALADIYKTGLQFSIQLTNEGVWGRYDKDPLTREVRKADYDSFAIYRRLASRKSAKHLVDARIEIDRREQQTRYYVNNQLLWVVKNWGKLTKDLFDHENGRRNRLVAYSPRNRTRGQKYDGWKIDEPNQFSLYIENQRSLDVADPNRHDEEWQNGGGYSPALVRLTNLPGYYNSKVQFYDDKSERYSSLWGQGAVAGLKSLRVATESESDKNIYKNDEESGDGKEDENKSDNDSLGAADEEANHDNSLDNNKSKNENAGKQSDKHGAVESSGRRVYGQSKRHQQHHDDDLSKRHSAGKATKNEQSWRNQRRYAQAERALHQKI